MKIVELKAENFKRLEAVEIRPTSGVVEITGANGQGKTSVLDALWVALAGKDASPTVPIRKGQERARIRLDLGEIIVTRLFSRAKEGGYTTSITVENGDGARYPSPQRMLDALLGSLSFDPLAFARMKPREQFDALRRFVPDVDFDGIDNANRGDFERRAELNRFAKQERGAAAAIMVGDGTPEELIDETQLAADLAGAADHNAGLERRRANRETVRSRIEAERARVASLEADIEDSATAIRAAGAGEVKRIEEQIERLKAQLLDAQQATEAKAEETAAALRTAAAEAEDRARALQESLDEAGELPAPIDAAAIAWRLEEARTTNAEVRKLLERRKHETTAEGLEAQAQALTEAIERRNAEKVAKVAATKMPVDGIEFGDGEVLLRGVPFSQGSDAEQLRTSVAIAAAMSPKLRVIRIRDGSLLDERSMEWLKGFAAEQDLQVWIEVVDSSGKIGFVIEEGKLRAHTENAA